MVRHCRERQHCVESGESSTAGGPGIRVNFMCGPAGWTEESKKQHAKTQNKNDLKCDTEQYHFHVEQSGGNIVVTFKCPKVNGKRQYCRIPAFGSSFTPPAEACCKLMQTKANIELAAALVKKSREARREL